MIAERIAPEQHDSLPGIAEPAENPHLTGHAPTLERLFAAFRNGRLHHALLLHGPRGIGKATLAFHLARRILLETAAGDASPEQLFRQTAIGAHPALLHLARPADGEPPRIGESALHRSESRATSRSSRAAERTSGTAAIAPLPSPRRRSRSSTGARPSFSNARD